MSREDLGRGYGRLLGSLDDATLALWAGGGGCRARVARHYARAFGLPELAAHHRFRVTLETLERCGGSVVLDLGAGSGLYSLAAAARHPATTHFVGDVSRRHMHRAGATGRALGLRVRALGCSVEALPLASDSVDTVLLVEVLQFVDRDREAVREIGRVLRPGGVWLCEQEAPQPGAPLVAGGENRLRQRRGGYTAEALRRLAADAGMEPEAASRVTGPVGRWWEGLDGRIFAINREMHHALFPLVRLLARLSAPLDRRREGGTVLYRFRKAKGRPVAGTAGGDV